MKIAKLVQLAEFYGLWSIYLCSSCGFFHQLILRDHLFGGMYIYIYKYIA